MIAAAAAAAQPAAPANPEAQQMPMQHEAMKKGCCDCCKDMEAEKKDGHHAERGGHAG
jgi:hypothetical protein